MPVNSQRRRARGTGTYRPRPAPPPLKQNMCFVVRPWRAGRAPAPALLRALRPGRAGPPPSTKPIFCSPPGLCPVGRAGWPGRGLRGPVPPDGIGVRWLSGVVRRRSPGVGGLPAGRGAVCGSGGVAPAGRPPYEVPGAPAPATSPGAPIRPVLAPMSGQKGPIRGKKVTYRGFLRRVGPCRKLALDRIDRKWYADGAGSVSKADDKAKVNNGKTGKGPSTPDRFIEP